MVRQRHVEFGALFLLAATAIWDGVGIAMQHQTQLRAREAGGYEVLLGGLLACLLIVSWRQRTDVVWAGSERTRWAIMAMAMLVAYAVALPILGYLLSTLLVVIAYLRLFSSYRWISILGYAFTLSAGSSYLWASLAIMLPGGVLPWP